MTLRLILPLLAALLISACGGGGGGGGTGTPPPPIGGTSTYTITVSKTGAGTIVSTPAGVDCGATCSASYAADTTITLTATPAAGQRFSGWSGDCSTGALTCTLLMGANKSVGAAFAALPVAGWQSQLAISPSTSVGHGDAKIVIANDGRAMATWSQPNVVGSTQIGDIVWASRYTPGSGWTAPTEIARIDGNVSEYFLSMNSANGKGMLGLTRNINTTYDVMAMPFDLAAAWGAPVIIDARTDGATGLSMGTDSSGNSVAVWQGAKPTGIANRAVWSNRYTPASGWGTPQLVNNGADDGAINPEVAVTPSGDAVVVWRGFGVSSGTAGLWSSKYTAGGSWSAPARIVIQVASIPSETYDIGTFPTVASDSNGNVLLAWTQVGAFSVSPQFRTNVWTLRYTGGAWSTTPIPIGVDLNTVPATSDISSVKPMVRLNAQGRAMVSWTWSGARGVWVNRSRADGSWESAQDLSISTNNPTSSNTQSGGIDDQGNMTIAWYSSITSNIVTRRYTEGSGWGAPLDMVTYDNTRGVLANGSLAMNNRGDGVLIYGLAPDLRTGGSQIFGRIYNSGQ
jgi:Divergent InlB B-repeat domain